MKIKALTISSIYPNTIQPRNGIFIEHRVHHLIKSGQIDIKVIAPVPWFPISNNWFGKYSVYANVVQNDKRLDIDILYPRYPVIPKIGMNLAPWFFAAALIRPINRMIRTGYDFDIIDAYYFYPDGVAAAWLGRYFRKPVVITALGSDINLIAEYRLPRNMIKWAAHHASGVTCVSSALKEKLNEFITVDKKARVIRHGVDLELFSPPSDRAAIRSQLGFNRITLLSIGHLIELKGHHITIQALVDLHDVELVIAGHGPDEVSLRRLALQIGVADRVRFLGHVDQQNLPAYYGAADALVLMSSNEGIPNVLLESMACGTPVIATRVGGIAEVITSPEAGVLVVDRTPWSLVQAIRKLFIDPINRSATRQFVEQFTWEDTTEQHLCLLREVIAAQSDS